MPRRHIAILVLGALMLTIFVSPILPTTSQMDDLDTLTTDVGRPSERAASSSFPVPMNISGNTYSDHGRITITSNVNFLSQKTAESWSGNGSQSNPIVITGYNITSTSGVLISISNTDLHFRIDGNFLYVPTENYNGISLSNVTNGLIIDNYFNKVDFGMSMSDVNFTSIQMNHFDAFTGISISSGNNNSIDGNYFTTQDTAVMFTSASTYFNLMTNNTFTDSSFGVYLLGSGQNDIHSNYFSQIAFYSIYLTQFGGAYSTYNVIRNNLIQDSVDIGATGIFVYSYSDNNAIYSNIVTNVSISIRLSYGNNNTIYDNQILKTTQAISIESSQWNEVYRNNVSDVTDGFDSAYALYIYQSHNNTLYTNNITDTDNAVFLYQSSENALFGNNMTDVRNNGMVMLTATFNDIHDNEIIGGLTGFDIGSSSLNNTLSRNKLSLQNQGIQVRTSSNYNIFDGNRIENMTNYGLDSTASSHLTILNNTIINSGIRGINIDTTSYPIIGFNTIINTGQYGIYLDTGFSSKIYNNTIKLHSIGGAYLISSNQHNISYNVIANSSIGLSLIISDPGYVIGNTFSNNSDTGLFLDASDGCEITDNLLEHNGVRGIRLSSSDGTTVANNTLNSNSQHGIVVQFGSSLNFIQENEIINNPGYGIWLAGHQNWVRLNTISNSDAGLFIDGANINSIEANMFAYNTDGIRLYNADDNTILLNTIFNNTQYGVLSESGFPDRSTANLIYNNTVIANGVIGVYLYAETQTTEVKWNDFIDNTVHGGDSNIPAYGNVWDANFFDDWDQQQSYYSIDFDTRDYSPETLPLNPSEIHFLLPAMILTPEESEMYTEMITTTWSSGYDSDNHTLLYSLYYSNNTGVDWYFIVDGLSGNSYQWNASSFTEGSNYQLMIVTIDSLNNSVQTTTNSFSIDTSSPTLGTLPSNFTAELSHDSLPEQYFSAFDSNPDYAYVEWMGSEMSERIYWSSGAEEPIYFFEGSIPFGVGVHALYLVVLDMAGHETRYLFYITVEDTVDPTIVIDETDQTFELGPHGNELSWTTFDLAQGSYEAYFNDSLDITGTWVSYAGTYLNVDSYMPGIYNVTVVFYDTSGNSVTRAINLTIIDTTSPSIGEFPDGYTIEFGSTSNYLNWTVSELDPSVFNITINHEFSEQLSYSNGTVFLNIDGLPLGYNNITVVFFDKSGNMENDSVFITVNDTISPVITSQSNIVLEFGSVGNIVNWTATDLLPENYTVYIDDSYWASGLWSSDSVVSVSVDGLSIGNHSLQIFFADSSNNPEMAEIMINVHDTISPELLSSPDDIQYNSGTTGNTLSWIVEDFDAGNYSIFIDDTYITTDTWTNSLPVVLSVDGLSIGRHTVEIRLSDGSGNIVLDTVIVTVVEVNTPTTTTTSELPTGGGSFPILGIVGIGMSAIFLVVLGIMVIRKKTI